MVPSSLFGVHELICVLYKHQEAPMAQHQYHTLVLTISFPVPIKSALLLVGNVMEKMTVGTILMNKNVVSTYVLYIF